METGAIPTTELIAFANLLQIPNVEQFLTKDKLCSAVAMTMRHMFPSMYEWY